MVGSIFRPWVYDQLVKDQGGLGKKKKGGRTGDDLGRKSSRLGEKRSAGRILDQLVALTGPISRV